ncbi:MAG TPA: DUF5665 domain-containing protein [Pseudomonadales bacterium]|nr:DUF5665 domain-containing protein [Pseudomonadales bacterium]
MSQEPPKTTQTDQAPPLQTDKLLREMLHSAQATERHLYKLSSHKFMTDYDSTRRQLFMQFMKGAAFGLGSVIGATLFVSLIIYLLSQVAFLPIIGEWIKVILAEIHK